MSNKIKNEIVDVAVNLSEVLIDSILSDGLFRDIPFFGSLISVGRLITNVNDALLLKKIIIFINCLNLSNQSEIDEFKKKYFKQSDYKKIGIKILLLLNKFDDEQKAQWLGKCFLLFLDKEITRDLFIRISAIINNAYVPDIEKIVVFRENEKITSFNNVTEDYVLNHLFTIGVLSNIGFDGGNASGNNSGTIYSLNTFGELFLEYLL